MTGELSASVPLYFICDMGVIEDVTMLVHLFHLRLGNTKKLGYNNALEYASGTEEPRIARVTDSRVIEV
jgi:hypothetical protein